MADALAEHEGCLATEGRKHRPWMTLDDLSGQSRLAAARVSEETEHGTVAAQPRWLPEPLADLVESVLLILRELHYY